MTELLAVASRFGLGADTALFVLTFARMAGFVMLMPGIGDEGVPPRIRLGLAAALAILVMPIASEGLAARLDGSLAAGVAVETLIGLGLGLIMRVFYAAISIAGSYAATQIGLGGAVFFDPASGQSTSVTRLMQVAALVVLFSAGVHHLLLGALVTSYGIGVVPEDLARDAAAAAVGAASAAFALGAQLAAPFLIYGVLFNVALGLVNRLAPQVQLFFIAQPLNIVLGLALLGVTIGPLLLIFAGRVPAMLSAMLG